MASHAPTYNGHYTHPRGRDLALYVLRMLWLIVRLPALAVLLVLEPLVSLVLTAFGFIGIAVAVFLKFSGDLPHFPFWEMMAFSVGALLLLMAYHALIGILSR